MTLSLLWTAVGGVAGGVVGIGVGLLVLKAWWHVQGRKRARDVIDPDDFFWGDIPSAPRPWPHLRDDDIEWLAAHGWDCAVTEMVQRNLRTEIKQLEESMWRLTDGDSR